MDARRAEQVERQNSLWEEAIPVSEWEVGVNINECGDEVIFERANSAFGSIDAMLFGGNTLELDVIFHERILEVLAAFVVEDV